MDQQSDTTVPTTVTLTAEDVHLAELLAEHTHAQWVQRLYGLGWRYGAQLDPANRLHPDLRPFRELPAAVREDKLQIFLDNLRFALSLGYRLDASQADYSRLASDLDARIRELAATHPGMPPKLASVMVLRREILKAPQQTPESHCALADTLLQMGEPLIAYDVLMDGLKHWPHHLRLQQLLALSLARSGATLSANQLLRRLVESGQSDEQTLGLLARTHKDLWQQAETPQERAQQLQLAANRYLQAYQKSRSLWTGINAATMAIVMGNAEQAHSLAAAVRQQGLADLAEKAETGRDPYWVLATLGEAELILGNWAAAERYYVQAAEVGQRRVGDLCSSYRNGAFLLQHFGEATETLRQWLCLPRVVVFCGHRIDQAARQEPRFPAAVEGAVYAAIKDRLQQCRGQVGYASAACGSDILFLEALLELGGEYTVVLPYQQEEFIRHSVCTDSPGNWVERCHRVLTQARDVIIASDWNPEGDALAYEYSNRMLHGLAQIRAQQLNTDLVPLAVWNGQPGDGPGGTASTVARWRQWSPQVDIIDLAAIMRASGIQVPQMPPSSPAVSAPVPSSLPVSKGTVATAQREIRALLFADVVHYTQLTEDQILIFMQHFLKTVTDLSAHPAHPPLTQNTWGDALYCVFAEVREAGLFALELCNWIQTVSWADYGLPADLNARIALHAGPVFRNINPVTGQVNYIGSHVNYAARIEPITPPGKVYASQAFAAIASSEGVSEFSCDYVGQMPWAKQYGTFPTFHVHRH